MKTNSDFNLQDRLINDSVFTIGNVFSVKGKDIVVRVNKDKNLPHLFFKGKIVKNVSVGLSNYVKIIKGFTEIICKVEGEYLEEDKSQIDKKYINEKQKMTRSLNVSVFGFYDSDHKFQHGIKEMPLIGSECRLLSKKEFEEFHQLSEKDELSINIGSLIDEEMQNISISVKKLFAGHIGIFGNTGSGKSNTLAKMYTELFSSDKLNEKFKSKSKFIFIDFNGEYSKDSKDEILTDKKNVYKLNTRNDTGDKYPISKTEIEKLELLSILLDATEKTQQPFLHRAISTKWFDKENQGHLKEIDNINKNLKNIFTKKDKNFNVPFIKKFVDDFQNIGFKIENENKNIDDIKLNTTTGGFYLGLGTYYDAYDTKNKERFIGKNGYLNVIISSKEKGLFTLQKIQFKILDRYYFEILIGHVNQEHISPLIGRLKKRFDMLNKVFEIKDDKTQVDISNIQVIDLKNVNLEIKKLFPY